MRQDTKSLTSSNENFSTVFPPLEKVTKPNLTTEEAAFYCDRAPQTMRSWASTQPVGVPRPLRINGRLAWPTSSIRAFVAGVLA